MPELGNKHECFSCGAKFYDLGKPEAICPKCGANQRDARKQETPAESALTKKRRREEVVRVVEPEEDLLAGGADEDFAEEEIETPEGVGEEESAVQEKDDLDDDE